MSALSVSSSTLVAIIITLSFAAGLNVYATVFSLGVMARLHWIALPEGLHVLEHTGIIIASAILFAAEFVADKIPGFDLVWNALHTFVRVPVAALMAYAVGEHLSPGMHVLVTCVGAVFAAIAHSSKSAMRIAVTPSPEPISNIALSTAEDGMAVGLSALVLHHPIAGGITVLALALGCVAGVWLGFRMIQRAFMRVFTERRRTENAA